jgi:hypothetical protein
MTPSSTSFAFFLSGAIFLGYGIIALTFARFWRRTGERFFLFFAFAFLLFAADQIILVSTRLENSPTPLVYLTRLAGFTLIVAAMIDQNRRGRTG